MLWRRSCSNGRFPLTSTNFGGRFAAAAGTVAAASTRIRYCPLYHATYFHNTAGMASTIDGEQADQWPATKVRSTFIDYFKKQHGHTFGMHSPNSDHECS